jgi:hypothetical protein
MQSENNAISCGLIERPWQDFSLMSSSHFANYIIIIASLKA